MPLDASTPQAVTSDTVGIPSQRYEELMLERLLSDTLLGGSKAVRAAREAMAPKHAAEEELDYQARLSATSLFNAYKDTVHKQAGKLLMKAPILEDDVPTALKKLAENIDGQGRALTPFVLDAVTAAMGDGISYILVDYPTTTPGATAYDQKVSGARPYWCLVKARDLIGWQSEDRGGSQTLTQVRVTENVREKSGAYGEVVRQRVRVLMEGNFELWERMPTQDNRQKWVLISSGTTSLQKITLVGIYTNRIGYMEGLPPLQALAEINKEHWVSATENRRALSFLRFAMLVLEGVDKVDGVKIGPNKVIGTPAAGAKAYYAEHSGKGMEAGFKDLEILEERMESAGMTVRIERAGAATATTAAINSAENNAALKAIAQGLQDSIELALQYTAEMLSIADGGSVKVFDEFGEEPPAGTPTELLSYRNSRNISRETLWKEAQRRRILAEDFDPVEEAKLLDGEAASDLNAMSGQPSGVPFKRGARQ